MDLQPHAQLRERQLAPLGEVKQREELLPGAAQAVRGQDVVHPAQEDLGASMIETPIEKLDPRDWEPTFRTVLGGTLNCMLAALPAMREASWGRVVNMHSPVAKESWSGFAAYNCTKDVIRALTRKATREWGQYGITVNCIFPLVNDGMPNRLAAIPDPDARAAAEAGQRSRMAVTDSADLAGDMAATAAFLASDEASFITGHLVRVDGGFSL